MICRARVQRGMGEALWGVRGRHWTWRKEQNLEKEKRGHSCQAEWREEKDQSGNEVGIAGADFACAGLDVRLDR